MAYANTFKRREMKFLLNKEQYEIITQAIAAYMTADSYGLTTVKNIYLDNKNFDVIRRSVAKPPYKEKIRLRCYGDVEDDSTAFLEIKKKYKGIVYKRRLELSYIELFDYVKNGTVPQSIPNNQVFEEIDYGIKRLNLVPKAVVYYDRVAYFGNENKEFRVTFDGNIRGRFSNLDLRSDAPCRLISGQPYRIMEVKSADSVPLWLARILSENRIFSGSYSKYGSLYKSYIRQIRDRGNDKCLAV